MTKNTAMPIVMTDEELLTGIEKSLRNQRLKAAIRSRLISQREKLLKKMGRGQAAEQQDASFPTDSEFTEPQRRVLRGDSLLGTLSEEDRAMWESIYRSDNERRAQRPLQPKQAVSPAPATKPTASEVEALFNGGVKKTVQAARAFAPGPRADID